MMHQSETKRGAIRLLGITVRTNNASEADWMQGKIFPCVQRYFHQALAEQMPQRVAPGTTYCAYTDYESDHTGDYTYFIGEEVAEGAPVPEGFEELVIPAQTYAKFTTEPGSMPGVLRNAWDRIWEMGEKEFGGKRSYLTDFELYDERANDHSNLVVDILIGVDRS